MAAKAELPTKRQMVMLMQQGVHWQEAARLTGIHVSRSTAYRWFQGWRLAGEATLRDGRHGHPSKAREPVLNFLESRWSQAPQTKSSTIQKEVQGQFGQVISITHLNRLRKARGLANHPEKKTPLPRLLI